MPSTPSHPVTPTPQTRPAPPRESYHSGCTWGYRGTVNYDQSAVGVRRRCLGQGPRDSATIYLLGRHPRPFISHHKSRLFFFFFFFCDCLASFFYALLTPPPDISPTSSPTPHGCVCIHYTATKRYMTSMPDDKLFKLKRKPWQ